MFHVRMSPDERRMLEALAEEEGISASDWVRMTIRRSFAERFNGPRSKRKGKS
jgi:predicted HicB family RNase H-like nuclease